MNAQPFTLAQCWHLNFASNTILPDFWKWHHYGKRESMIKSLPIQLFFIFFGASLAFSQHTPPVIKASSRNAHIRDGLHFKKNYWYIMPEKKPDYYYVEVPGKAHQVTFITNLDSISFAVTPGESYDFIILLNDRDSCLTRVSATYKKPNTLQRTHTTPDTIPFTIGSNSKIYFRGQLNGSQPLDIQFDLGAGGCLLKEASIKKVNIQFDATINLTNSDGTHTVPSSSSNRIRIGNLVWDKIPIAVADNMTSREDMIVGNALFAGKVVEINYDKKFVLVYDTLPALNAGYSRHDMILDGGAVPFVQGSSTMHGKTRKGWFMFDTGAYTTILQDNEIHSTNKMIAEAKQMLGMSAETQIPQLTIGDHTFARFNYSVAGSNHDDQVLGLLGNDLLKRFNVVLDNVNGYLYLSPNTLINEPYANPEYYVVRGVMIVLIPVVLFVSFIAYRWHVLKKS